MMKLGISWRTHFLKVLLLFIIIASHIMFFYEERAVFYANLVAAMDEKPDNVCMLVLVGTRSGRSWLDLVVLASLPPLYRLMEGKPLLLICNDITTRLTPNSEKFLLQYKPQKVIIIGDDLFSPDIVSILPNASIQRISGESLDELTVKISKKFFSNSSSAILVEVSDYASALSIVPYASYIGAPIFYYDETVSKIVLDELRRLGVQQLIIVKPSSNVLENLEPSFSLDIVYSLNEILNRTVNYLRNVEYVTIVNPLDRYKGNRISLIAPLFTLMHKGILIPVEYDKKIIEAPLDELSIITDKPAGASEAPLICFDFDATNSLPQREEGASWVMFPVNGTYYQYPYSSPHPFGIIGAYGAYCYLGASLRNSSNIDIIALDTNLNQKIGDDEVFRIINGTVKIPQLVEPKGSWLFTDIRFENFSERKLGRGISMIFRPSTWFKGRVIIDNNPVEFILSPQLRFHALDPLWNPWRGAYRNCLIDYITINFDLNGNKKFNDTSEGPYSLGSNLQYGNKSYLIDFYFFHLNTHIAVLRLIYPSPMTFLSNINSQTRNLKIKFMCLIGSPEFVPMQYSMEPTRSQCLVWGDYNYTGPNINNLHPAVGRIDADDVTDASLVYLRTATYCQIASSYQARKVSVFCDHVPPYSVGELRQAGYEVFLMGSANMSSEKAWIEMRDSDMVLFRVGHAYWPFEYAAPEFNKPSLIIHWMCRSAYEHVGYKSFFHAGAVLFIGTTEYMAGPEGGDVELIHTLLNYMFQNYTVGEAFNMAKLFIDCQKEGKATIQSPMEDRYYRFRLLTILGSLIFGDPAFRLCSSSRVNNTNYSYLYRFYPLNLTHVLACVNVKVSFQNEYWWETYAGKWCGVEESIPVSHLRMRGTTVSQFEQSVPFPPHLIINTTSEAGYSILMESGSGEILLPTNIFIYPVPKNAKILNITLTSNVPYLTVWKKMWLVPSIEPFSGKYLVFEANDTRYVMWNMVLAEYNKDNRTLLWSIDKCSFEIFFILDINSLTSTHFKTKCLVDAISPYGVPLGGGYYENGETAHLSVQGNVNHGNGTRRILIGWYKDNACLSTKENISVKVTEPVILEVKWKTEYLIDVTSQVDQVSGSGWYELGSQATVSVSTTRVEKDLFTSYVFEGWSVDGEMVSTSPTYAFTVTGPVSLTAAWKAETNLTTVGAITMVILLVIVVTIAFLKRRKQSS